MATSTAGSKPDTYQKLEGDKWRHPDISLAVTPDKHVILGTDAGKPGIYRLSGENFAKDQKPLLPQPGGVAADIGSLKWAATQAPNQICVFEGEEMIKRLRLPPNKSHYRNGLLSFAPAENVVVATRASDQEVGEVWLLKYDINKDEVRSLFPWNKERMVDFVVGPRMYWEQNNRPQSKSIY
jgi:hypothetical protein